MFPLSEGDLVYIINEPDEGPFQIAYIYHKPKYNNLQSTTTTMAALYRGTDRYTIRLIDVERLKR